ncbi:hypothetical protein FHR70_000759 [Microvirga lupini]|uniref:Uncharacterized protein n=1 Tax=Microvirga lupini TaxID=420324 RepID=A0A7W4YVZ7_9HYPH|nr:hypothetical protein [Microvirga lupini]MBB3017719.1 hypothetical protein [Microvirga lupini]
MLPTAPPTDQRAGIRPIAFVLNNGGSLGSPVSLKIRPEDLQRNEPSRIAVTQTLGRTTQGWADNFGAGLPSCTISGHTGWRKGGSSGEDGAEHFLTLHDTVMPAYHAAKQAAIEIGTDPASVKLLFVDMLDGFCWNVAPMSFTLRRSRNRPLLFQYNIALQAISTDIDNPLRILPFLGNIPAGLDALGGVLGRLWDFALSVQGWVSSALGFVDKALAPIAATVKTFVDISASVLGAVSTAVGAVRNGVSGVANRLIGIAGDMAQVGINVFRTISSISNLPAHLRAAISRVGAAYNEALCILRNSLRPRKTYQEYDGLYGASNCSSTTGGRSMSAYTNMNAFALMQEEKLPIELNSAALSSVSSVNRSDPVLAPIPLAEIGRHLDNINAGTVVNQ